MLSAIEHMAKTDPKLGLIAGGFAKHLRKHPIPDDEITAWVTYMRTMLDAVLDPSTLEADTLPDAPYVDEFAGVLLPGEQAS